MRIMHDEFLENSTFYAVSNSDYPNAALIPAPFRAMNSLFGKRLFTLVSEHSLCCAGENVRCGTANG
jgi:hypothetical protein